MAAAASSVTPRLYGVLFLLAFALSVTMLLTDKNLQTDFGSVSSGYAPHWYVVLVTAIVELGGGVGLLLWPSRLAVKAGTAGSGLLALLFLGDIATYAMVGFPSADAFARYLFGIDYFGGNLRYLYDVLLALFLVTLGTGATLLYWTRPAGSASSASPTSTPSA